MQTNFDLTKPRHSELILPVPSIIQFVQIQTSFSFLLRLFLLEAKEIRDFFLSSVTQKTSLDSHLFIKSFIQNNNRLSFTTQQGKVFYTLQLFYSIISKNYHYLYNMACLKKLNTITCSFSLSFSVGLVFEGAFSFCNRCASPCRTEERRRQYLVGGYFAIIIQAMFERATKLRRLT